MGRSEFAPGAGSLAHHGARIDARPTRISLETSRPHQVEWQPQRRNGALGLTDFGSIHLREILAPQHLVSRNRETGVDLDFGDFACWLLLLMTLEHGLTDAVFSRTWLLLLAVVGGHRRKHRQHLLDQLARFPEQSECLVEGRMVLVARHQHCMQRPVEIVTGADARRQHCLDGVLHGSRANAHAGLAQSTREIHDVVGDAPVRPRWSLLGNQSIHGAPYSAAESSAFTSLRMRRPSPCSMRAMSS